MLVEQLTTLNFNRPVIHTLLTHIPLRIYLGIELYSSLKDLN